MKSLYKSVSIAAFAFALVFISNNVFAQSTQIDYGTFVTIRPDGQNQGSSYQRDLASDPAGNVFGAGNTNVSMRPTTTAGTNVYQTTYGGGQWDGYVYKLAADGKSIIWWTYIGGGGNDDIWSVDYSKENGTEYLYCAGFSDGNISIPAGKLKGDAYKSQRDAFLAKFNATDGSLVWFTWLGTAGHDCGFTVQASDNFVHMGGIAPNGLSTTTGAYKTSTPDLWTFDGFYARYDLNGNLNYLTYTNTPSSLMDINNGKGAMGVRGLDATSDNEVYLAGTTYGNDVSFEKNNSAFTSGQLSTAEAGFLIKLNPLGAGTSDLQFATKIRNTAAGKWNYATDVKHRNGNIYLLGYTDGVINGIPSTSAQKTNRGGSDVYVVRVKFNSSNSTYSFDNASMYGGSGNDYTANMSICKTEPTFTGQTASNNLVMVSPLTTGTKSSPSRTMNSFQGGGNDMFTASLSADFSNITFSTYIGGTNDEHPFTSYTLAGKTGGHALNGKSLLVGASTHSFSDMPTTSGSWKHVTETTHMSAPDLDFIVSFEKAGETCEITSTNSIPVLDLDKDDNSRKLGADYQTTFKEDSASVKIADTDIEITDGDNASMSSATITISNPFSGDIIQVVGNLPSGISLSPSSTSTKIILTGVKSIADYQTAIRQIEYSNSSQNIDTTTRKVTVSVFDGTDNSNTATAYIKIKNVNDGPLLDLDANNNSGKTGNDFQNKYLENGTGVKIADSDITITDVDNTNMSSATITLTNTFAGDIFKVVGSLPTDITSSVSTSGTNTIITLTGSASIANYQTAIRQIEFSSTSDSPNSSDRIVNVIVNDDNANSNNNTVAVATIQFLTQNDCPVVDLNGASSGTNFSTTFTEKGSAVGIVSSSMTLNDPDATTQNWDVNVTLTNKQAGDYFIKGANVGSLVISDVDSSVSNKLTITVKGIGTNAEVISALNTIKFKNGSTSPNTTTRSLTLTFKDDTLVANPSKTCPINTNIGTTTISITTANDCPTIDLNGGVAGNFSTTYTENEAAKSFVSSSMTINDPDITAGTSQNWKATITLTNRVSPQDSLIVSSGIFSGDTISNVDYSVAGKATVTIKSNKTSTNLINLIKQVKYKAGGDSVTTSPVRQFKITIADANNSCDSSDISTVTVRALQDCPTVDLNTVSVGNDDVASYTEGTPVAIVGSNIKIVDLDKFNQNWTATLTLTDPRTADSLILTKASVGSLIITKVNASAKTVTISGNGSSTQLATALQSIQFTNNSNYPTQFSASRNFTISFVSEDSSKCDLSRNVAMSISEVNACPVVTINGGSSTYSTNFTENGTPIKITNGVSVSDDKTDGTLTVSISVTNFTANDKLFLPQNKTFTTSGNIVFTGTINQVKNFIDSIYYQNTSENPITTPVITITVTDESNCAVSTTSSININNTNDCPTISVTANTANYVEKGAPVKIITAATIGDLDKTTQKWKATVTMLNAISLDSLFGPASNNGFIVTGITYSGVTPTLTIDGTGSNTNLATFLTGVTFKSGSDFPDLTTRQFKIEVFDEVLCTGADTSELSITRVNDNPKLTLDADNSSGTKNKADYISNYTEHDNNGVSIGDIDTKITDVDNTTMSSATIILTNKLKGDSLIVPDLTSFGGITSLINITSSQITVTLNGITTLSNYEEAIKAIKYMNTSSNPSGTTRVVTVQVNDGSSANNLSNIATDSIIFTLVNDPLVVKQNTVQTNTNTALTNRSLDSDIEANNTDPENDKLVVTQVNQTSKHGTLSVNLTNQTYTYNPNNLYYGRDTVYLQVCDRPIGSNPVGNCEQDTLYIVINKTNDGLKLDLDSTKIGTGHYTTFTEGFDEKGNSTGISAVHTTSQNVGLINYDLEQINSATITLINKQKGDTLIVKGGTIPGGLTYTTTVSGGKTEIVISGSADSTTYKNALELIQFDNNKTDINTTDRYVNFTVSNSNGSSNIAVDTIKVININQIPDVVTVYSVIKEDSTINSTLSYFLDKDSDKDNNTLSVSSIQTNGKHGTLTITGNTYKYIPDTDYFGQDTVVLTICDNNAVQKCANQLYVITITPVNDNPLLDLDKSNNHDTTNTVHYQTIYTEDNSKGVTIADSIDAEISDVDNLVLNQLTVKFAVKTGDTLTYGNLHGLSTSGVVRNITKDTMSLTFTGFATIANYEDVLQNIRFKNSLNSIDSTVRMLYVQVTDSAGGKSNVAISYIGIKNTNDNPVTVTTTLTTKEDSVICVDLNKLLENDSDPDGDAITIAAITKSTATNGTITVNGTTFCYNPDKNFNGKDSVTVSVCDPKGACSDKKVIFIVTPVNDVPYLDLEVSTKIGKDSADYNTQFVEKSGGVNIANVSDIKDVDDIDVQKVKIVLTNKKTDDSLIVGTLNGGIVKNVKYYNDSIVVVLSNYASINDYKSAIDGIKFNNTSRNPDSTTRVITVVSYDSTLSSNVATAYINFKDVNDAPDLFTDSLTTREDTKITVLTKEIINRDKDPEGDSIYVQNGTITTSKGGTVIIKGDTISYDPKKDFFGIDSVTITVCDIHNACNTKTLLLFVKPINDAPYLDLEVSTKLGKDSADYNGTFTEKGNAVAISNVSSISDIDNTTLKAALITLTNKQKADTLLIGKLPSGMSSLINSSDSTIQILIFKSAGEATLSEFEKAIDSIKFNNTSFNPNGTDRIITVIVSDDSTNSNVATATLKIVSVNDCPIVANNSETINEDQILTKSFTSLLTNDSDYESDSLRIITTQIAQQGKHGVLTQFTDSTYSYVPNGNFNGKDTVALFVSDGDATCKLINYLYITVNPINDDPIVKSEVITTYKNQPIIINFKSNDNDFADSTNLDYSKIVDQLNGKTVLNSNGTITYTPDHNFFGTDMIVYNVCDNGNPLPRKCKNDTIFITVNEKVNTCPVLTLDANMSNEKYLNGSDNGVTYVENSAGIPLADKDTYIKDLEDDQIAWIKIEMNTAKYGDSLYIDPNFSNNNINTKVSKDSLNRWTVNFTGRLTGGLADTSDFRKAIQSVRFINFRDDIKSDIRAAIFTISDGKNANGSQCNLSAVSYIELVPVNDNPLILNNDLVTFEDKDTTLHVNYITKNDFDADGDSLLVTTIVKKAVNGSFTFSKDSTHFTYSPDHNYFGRDTVIVSVCDIKGINCFNNYIYIQVLPVNDDPIVKNETYTYHKNKDENKGNVFTSGFESILDNDYDPDLGKVIVGLTKNDTIYSYSGKNGSLTVDNKNGTFTYESKNGLGKDVFIVEVCNTPTGKCKLDTVTIIVTGVPGGFSPEDDGTNDNFVIESDPNWGPFSLEVYNRWGEIVYVSNDYKNDWNGKSNKGISIGNDLPDGTYYIMIKYKNSSENDLVKYITLMRK